jgi:hypothetical protein
MNRDDVELATPHCFRRVMIRKGQHGTHHTCYRRMRYRAENTWVCSCGNEEAGELVVARKAAAAMTVAA